MKSGATLWIVGTSVSIEDDGYVTQLRRRCPELAIRNLSVGDQTSVMGYMRVLAHAKEIAPGDIVVWEYSLLDALLTKAAFFADDVHSARLHAWQLLRERRAHVIVLLVAPRNHATKRSACESRIVRDAVSLQLPCIDTRDLRAELGIGNASAHYRDDRHLRHDSPLIHAVVEAIVYQLRSKTSGDLCEPQKKMRRQWRWLGAAELAESGHATLSSFSNSLVAVEAAVLEPGARIQLPIVGRVVALGIVSTRDSGLIWCGHHGCPCASTALPHDLPYSFLLRTTAVRCKREVVLLQCTDGETPPSEVWHDYGLRSQRVQGKVAVYGVLLEQGSTPLLRWRLRFFLFRQRVHRWIRRSLS